MPEFLTELRENLFTEENLMILLRVVAIFVVGFAGVNLVKALVTRSIKKKASPQTLMLVRKAIFYVGAVLILFFVLWEAGLDLSIFLGTAGIAGIAIGFASQTSISNIISGLFLISEKAFGVNDVITVGDKTGIVMSIDLLSVKIRTYANTSIRIPNEMLIKTEVINVTKFPIRRLDLDLRIEFEEDVERVRDLLLDLAEKNPYCLGNPAPLFIFQGFGENGIELFLGLWFEKTQFINLKNTILLDIKKAFEAEDVRIPYRTVRIVDAEQSFHRAQNPV